MTHHDRLWYRRTFRLPDSWNGRNTLLHFGAIDWEAQVWVNGRDLGTHKGGYDAFTLDISRAVKPGTENELIVRVFDPTDAGTQPRGKQVRNPGGIFYTPTTGIWQTVWLEPVPETHIGSLGITTDLDGGEVRVIPQIEGNADGLTVETTLLDGRTIAATSETSSPIKLPPNPRLWSPDSPFLYGLKVRILKGGRTLDEVESYVGLRQIAIAKGQDGVNRITLNGKPVFMAGPLDQGFWPDGISTAPTDEALKYDVKITKKLGFNATRKHVKVEPDRWYYWCDRLGLLVWQDMPSGDRSIGPNDPDITRSPASAEQYSLELKAMIDGLRNHPSIIMWVVFNEGWGQFDTAKVAEWTKAYDPTRLVNSASGWTDRGVGDLHDLHSYPNPFAPLSNRSGRASSASSAAWPSAWTATPGPARSGAIRARRARRN